MHVMWWVSQWYTLYISIMCIFSVSIRIMIAYVIEQSGVSVAQFRGPSLRGLASVCICLYVDCYG